MDDENEAALLKRKTEIEQSQAETFEQAKQAGVDPKLIENARADWKQAQALYNLDRQLKMSTSGMRPELATPDSTPEMVDPKKAFTRLNRLYDSGRLQQAAGAHADQLIQQADAAWLHSQKVLARQRVLKGCCESRWCWRCRNGWRRRCQVNRQSIKHHPSNNVPCSEHQAGVFCLFANDILS